MQILQVHVHDPVRLHEEIGRLNAFSIEVVISRHALALNQCGNRRESSVSRSSRSLQGLCDAGLLLPTGVHIALSGRLSCWNGGCRSIASCEAYPYRC